MPSLAAENLFLWQEFRTNEKEPSRLSRRAFLCRLQNVVFCGAGSGFGACTGDSASARVGRCAGVRTHALEDSELRGLGFVRLSVLALVLRTDNLSVNEDMCLPEPRLIFIPRLDRR
jgi:hypothetical protein